MTQWIDGEYLTPAALNAHAASAASTAGFSTNTLMPESGNTVSLTSNLSVTGSSQFGNNLTVRSPAGQGADQSANTNLARLSTAFDTGRLQLWPDTSGTPWQFDAFGNELRIFKGGIVAAKFLANNVFSISNRTFNIATAATPTGTSAGTTGDIMWDSGFIYVCTSINSWKRATLSAF